MAYIFGVTTLTVQPNVYIIRTFNRSLPFVGPFVLFYRSYICYAAFAICSGFFLLFTYRTERVCTVYRSLESSDSQVANPNESESRNRNARRMKYSSFFACVLANDFFLSAV